MSGNRDGFGNQLTQKPFRIPGDPGDPLLRNLPRNGLPYGRSEEESQSLCEHGSVDANASDLTKAYDIALKKRMGVYVEPAKKKAYFPILPGSE